MVKMCDRFKHSTTRLIIGADLMYEWWKPPARMPEGLVKRIVDKLDALNRQSGALPVDQLSHAVDTAPARGHVHTTDSARSAIDAEINVTA